MTKGGIIIFGGTSEGRELAEYASEHEIPVTVSVVSAYGEHLLQSDDYVQVRQGALDPVQMRRFLEEQQPALILDATHPYARNVTKQIVEISTELGFSYERVLRGGSNLAEARNSEKIHTVSSTREAADILATDQAPVLLTTGSKELEAFVKTPGLQKRIYARVLPDSRVLQMCEDLGIRGEHLIAMQGPFSTEMNCAMLHQVKAGWLVTKESGARGGFSEKLEAAAMCGVSVIVLSRPCEEHGIAVTEAEDRMRQLAVSQRAAGQTKKAFAKEFRQLFLIGMGMGGGRQLTLEALEILQSADAVLGAPRMLEDVKGWISEHAVQNPIYLAPMLADWLEMQNVQKSSWHCRKVAVVYSGDTGFYSGASSLLAELTGRKLISDGDEPGIWHVTIYPGISSVSSLCARMQTSWEHLYLTSAHGRACDPVALLREHRRIFLLLGGEENLGSLCRKLCQAGMKQAKVTAGIHMGYPDEQIISQNADFFQNWEEHALTAVVVEE